MSKEPSPDAHPESGMSTPPASDGRSPAVSRRSFLTAAGGTAVALSILPGNDALAQVVSGDSIVPRNRRSDGTRRGKAFSVRRSSAEFQRDLPLPANEANGDEILHGSSFACFSKTLPHDALGEVSSADYATYFKALESGSDQDFANIPIRGPVRLGNPRAAFTFTLEGADSHHLTLARAPQFSSSETGAEMAELYWRALTRDVPFGTYESHELIGIAAEDLSSLSGYKGPKIGGRVTPQTIFRTPLAGDLKGPIISQFLWKPIPFGAIPVEQRMLTGLPSIDYMTRYDDWLSIQNGGRPPVIALDPMPRYIRSGRDLAIYLRSDFSYQAFLSAALILQGMGARLDGGNPYVGNSIEGGFITFGGAHLVDVVARVAIAALKAAWYQKWLVHRRLRPEEFAGRVHNHVTGRKTYPISEELLASRGLEMTRDQFGTALLPMAYPEGCPPFPAYPGGHAAISGACVTVLKAFFDETFVIPNAVVASTDGLSLLPWTGEPLTIGNELEKLASNIGIGRDTAGVHYRSDEIESFKLGEEVAIRIMQDTRNCYQETFAGFTLRKFDGTVITI